MIIPIRSYVEQVILAAEQFEASKVLQNLLTELGQSKYRKIPVDQLKTMVIEKIKPLAGHGVSLDKYDEFEKIVDGARNQFELLKYVSNFMLKGTGLGVQAAVDIDKDIITIGGKKYYHPLFRIMKQYPTIKGEFKADKIKDMSDVDGSQSFYFKNLDPQINKHIAVVGPGMFKIVDDDSESPEMDETKLVHELSYNLQVAQSPNTNIRRLMHTK